jgi:NADH:ubiquinone oxidoreductase subunit C
MDEAQLRSAEAATDLQVAEPLRASSPAPPEPVAGQVGTDLASVLVELGVSLSAEPGPPLVPVERHLELAGRLKHLGYRQLVSIVSIHWLAGTGRKGKAPDEPEHFETIYLLRTVGSGSRLASWAVRTAPGMAIPSLFTLFAGADWQEREQWDLVGVVFGDHPDLRRLMMPENYQGHPLRRDFPADAPCAPWR